MSCTMGPQLLSGPRAAQGGRGAQTERAMVRVRACARGRRVRARAEQAHREVKKLQPEYDWCGDEGKGSRRQPCRHVRTHAPDFVVNGGTESGRIGHSETQASTTLD